MESILGTYEDKFRCVMTHADLGVKLITDLPVEHGGKGESFSPTDVFAMSLAVCMMTLIGIQAKAMGIDLSGVEYEVTKEMSTGMPRRISKVMITFWIPGEYDEKQKQRLMRAAENCPVHHSLHPEVEQVITYHWESRK